MSDKIYLVAGCKPWNRRIFNEVISKYPGNWHFASQPSDLTLARVKKLNPRFIFSLHWSWKIPDEIVNEWECVAFHMSDVPYGRGGSPMQNLIIRGYKQTKLAALRMTNEFDAGLVYLKEDLCIECGSAEEIYIRATYKAAEMIKRIITDKPKPVEQKGKPITFKRRKPAESEIPECADVLQLYDFIRMLDAEGYPKAFIKHKGIWFEFTRVVLYNGKVMADVTVTKADEGRADHEGPGGSGSSR